MGRRNNEYEQSLHDLGVIPNTENTPELNNLDPNSVHRDGGVDASPHSVRREYFMYLCNMVNMNNGNNEFDVYDSNRTFFMLANKLFNTKFKFLIPMDENRLKDGGNLRYWYGLLGSNFNSYEGLDDGKVSVLEVLIALADRVDRDIMQGIEPVDRSVKWFWLFLNNLGIAHYTDIGWNYKSEVEVGTILDNWMMRNFDFAGNGSPFPLKNPVEDQRNVEIWNQVQYYIQENYNYLNQNY